MMFEYVRKKGMVEGGSEAQFFIGEQKIEEGDSPKRTHFKIFSNDFV
jgi:hypothetical protein